MMSSLLNLFYPKVCAGCNSLLYGNEYIICTSCRHELPVTNFELHHQNEAFMKFYGRLEVQQVCCFLYYHKSGIVQMLIHALKYKGQQEIGTMLGEWYGQELAVAHAFKDADFIVPVPLHNRKLRKRGYNQVSTFVNALSSKLQIPVNSGILYNEKYATSQALKSFGQRTSLRGKEYVARYDGTLPGPHLLIADDVLTTGATLEACGRALLNIPGVRISIVTIAFSH